MKNAMLLKTETAMKVPAAKSQISLFVCSSIGVSPVGHQPAKPNSQHLGEFHLEAPARNAKAPPSPASVR
jgi:hypothetical protein